MPWDMKAVEAPASAVKTALEDIPDDVASGIEEAFEYSTANPLERVVITFPDTDTRDLTRALIRSYAEVRPKGRLTASLWAVTVNADTGETEKDGVPALSMRFVPYKKKERASGNGAGGDADNGDGESGKSE
jgi:hypothetical protein